MTLRRQIFDLEMERESSSLEVELTLMQLDEILNLLEIPKKTTRYERTKENYFLLRHVEERYEDIKNVVDQYKNHKF